MTLYSNLITLDGREETKHVFHQGVSRIVCRFSTTGAQNPQFVNLAADFKSRALIFMCKLCIRTVKDSSQNAPKVAIEMQNPKIFLERGHYPLPKPHPQLGGDTLSPHPTPSAPAIFHTKKLCSKLSSSEVRLYTENGRFAVFSPICGA